MIYLDNQATTPVDPIVLEAMMPFFGEKFGNAASVHHGLGCEAKEAVEIARRTIADVINALSREIIFTSGATESINLAIKGLCANHPDKKHIITQATEHKAVLDTCEALANQGWDITILSVDEYGRVDSDDVKNAIRDETVLVTIMHVNNEIGTIQPITEIGEICKENNIFFMVDACQSLGKLPLDVNRMKIDLMVSTAHKIYGPKGIGCLYVRQKNPKVEIQIQIDGGGHERGMRSGTLPVPLIVGFDQALKVCLRNGAKETGRISSLRDLLYQKIKQENEDVILNGPVNHRLAGNLNLCFPGLDAESLITRMKGIACSTGSACSSANLEPSHVLKAIGLENEYAHGSIRFSIGRFNTEHEIQLAGEEICKVVYKTRKKTK